jgi:hypothetical protein
MAQATDMNAATPMSSEKSFGMQMEGYASAGVYILCFGWIHFASEDALITANVLAVFLVGLMVVPLVAALPMFMLRRMVVGVLGKRASVAAFLPFARFALYALQGVLVWVATREAYALIFDGSVFG